jgi:acyl-CoA reductase-like NAD-dependent aldehyde dehydrogenase
MSLDTTSFYNIINNVLTSTAQTRHGINPATLQPNPEVPITTSKELDQAVSAAKAAFKKWSSTTFAERRDAINRYADSLEANTTSLAQLLTREQGKPLSQATQELELAVYWARTLATLTVPETVLEASETRQIIHRYTPLGVVGAIVPWNYPVVLAIGKIISAVYTGNTVILKPSPYTPYCDLKLAELAIDHFPPGVIQALSGDDELGPMITEHAGFDKISFTGSTVTGRRVMASCSKTLKRITLELGGNDAAIICDDVDIEAVVPKVNPSLLPLKSHSDRRLSTYIGCNPVFSVLGPELHDDQTPLHPRVDIRSFPGEIRRFGQRIPDGRRNPARCLYWTGAEQDAIRKGPEPPSDNRQRPPVCGARG